VALAKTRVLSGCRPESFPLEELMSGGEPVVLAGFAKEWPLVQAGLRSDREAMDYLRSFYNGKTVGTSFGEPDIAGRLFYNADFTELNFVNRRARLDDVLSEIEAHLQDERAPTRYIASTTIDACLPGFRKANDVGFATHGFDPLASIWIGNRTIASCHYDAPNNLACCVVGQRRFTMFPPEQIFNLYPGPLEPTPGGQAVSVVDFANPDFGRYPRFSRCAGRRSGGGSVARRCGVHPQHVVASHRSAEPIQHAGELLVGPLGCVHPDADECAPSRVVVASRPAGAREARVEECLRVLRFRPLRARRRAPARAVARHTGADG